MFIVFRLLIIKQHFRGVKWENQHLRSQQKQDLFGFHKVNNDSNNQGFSGENKNQGFLNQTDC